MDEMHAQTGGRWAFSDAILDAADLPSHIREAADRLMARGEGAGEGDGVVVCFAREILQESDMPPGWSGAETRYLVIVDVPEPAILRLPTILRLHKPDRRMQITRDPVSVRRLIIAQFRAHPFEGIVNAYLLDDSLTLVLGDLSARSFPIERIPRLKVMNPEQLERFELDPDGSFVHWPREDVHLGASELIQAVDPMYLADVEIQRYEREKTSLALLQMREGSGLRQLDIPGLSARQVRRLEQEKSRLTADAATKFARAFGQSLDEFLEDLGGRLSRLDTGGGSDRHGAPRAGGTA